MLRLLVNWLLSAASLMVVSAIVPGIKVAGFGTAMVAAIVIAAVNWTIGLVLRIVTFPLTILTLGLFWLILNAFLLKLAAAFVPGFKVNNFLSAFIGSILLTLVNVLLRWVAM